MLFNDWDSKQTKNLKYIFSELVVYDIMDWDHEGLENADVRPSKRHILRIVVLCWNSDE